MNTLRYFTWLFMLGSLLVIQACDDEKSLNLNVTQVATLYTPDDNLYVQLQPAEELSQSFEWDRAYAEDGSLVLYEVAFDEENGDFSQPIYKVVSDGGGVDTKLTLSHAALNQIAKIGGVKSLESKKFKWTVFSSKGDNIVPAAMSRVIELERPSGLDVVPTKLYITGSATEGGADVANAKAMRQISPGVFEIYTKMKPGTFKFIDALEGTTHTYFIDEINGSKKVMMDGENTFEGDEKVQRITLDCTSQAVQVAEVKYVGFWYCWENKILWDLEYANDGVWRVDDVTVTLSTVPWGLEERHKYKMIVNKGEEDVEEWWGYAANDSPGQDGKYGTTAPEYFYAFKISNNDQWNYAWKLDRPAVQGKQADFILSFNASEPYHMNYIIH